MTITETSMTIPTALRARVAADCHPVRPLAPPHVRALAAMPFALVALLAAPLWFSVRADAPALGLLGSWGLSFWQVAMALAILVAALREAVPGRAWSGRSLALWIALPPMLVAVVTWTTWEASAVTVGESWWRIAAMCFGGSLASSLPLLTVSSVLSARAFPTRPGVTGLLGGLAAGLVADAGWRMFCHFSEPAHVLAAHLGGVLAAGCLGAILTRVLVNRRRL
jgi:hypothetical protein